MKKFFKYALYVLMFMFSFPAQSWANGGIPFWINTIQAVASSTVIKGISVRSYSFVATLLCLLLVVLVETTFLKKRYFKSNSFKQIFKVVSISNLVSTLIGGIILIVSFYLVEDPNKDNIGYLIFGPLFVVIKLFPSGTTINSLFILIIVILYNVFFCILSFFIERPITKHYFKNSYDIKMISKGVLNSNILSYVLSFFLMLPIYLIMLGLLRIF